MCDCTRKEDQQHKTKGWRSALISEIYVDAKGMLETVITSLESGGNAAHAITCCKLLSRILDKLVTLI
jgi:predicted transcriptional regulator